MNGFRKSMNRSARERKHRAPAPVALASAEATAPEGAPAPVAAPAPAVTAPEPVTPTPTPKISWLSMLMKIALAIFILALAFWFYGSARVKIATTHKTGAKNWDYSTIAKTDFNRMYIKDGKKFKMRPRPETILRGTVMVRTGRVEQYKGRVLVEVRGGSKSCNGSFFPAERIGGPADNSNDWVSWVEEEFLLLGNVKIVPGNYAVYISGNCVDLFFPQSGSVKKAMKLSEILRTGTKFLASDVSEGVFFQGRFTNTPYLIPLGRRLKEGKPWSFEIGRERYIVITDDRPGIKHLSLEMI